MIELLIVLVSAVIGVIIGRMFNSYGPGWAAVAVCCIMPYVAEDKANIALLVVMSAFFVADCIELAFGLRRS